jgi:hypothetical protein
MTLKKLAYLCVIYAVLVNHIPPVRAWLEVTTDKYYYEYAEKINLWEAME